MHDPLAGLTPPSALPEQIWDELAVAVSTKVAMGRVTRVSANPLPCLLDHPGEEHGSHSLGREAATGAGGWTPGHSSGGRPFVDAGRTVQFQMSGQESSLDGKRFKLMVRSPLSAGCPASKRLPSAGRVRRLSRTDFGGRLSIGWSLNLRLDCPVPPLVTRKLHM